MNRHDRPMESLERRIRDAESDLFAVLERISKVVTVGVPS
jgi:hypothetical protein